ncbi:MAG: hypothetical protein ABIZ91_06900 [Gemmatimonadaceae bacterium]
MTNASLSRRLLAPLGLVALAFSASCRETEPQPPRATLSTAREVEVGLVASTLTPRKGDTLVIVARLTSGNAVKPAASFTARLAYDAARLTFAGEAARGDGGLRVINGDIPGDVRVAGIASDGFRSGDLVGLRFVMQASGSVGELRWSVDELHATDGEDLGRVVVRAPTVDAGVAR